MRVIARTIGIGNSGIYQIQSKIKNWLYIGSSKNLKNRKSEHFNDLKNNKHGNIHLQRHFKKYGEDDLIFGIIEFCSEDDLIKREQYYMDKVNPKFNICKIAASRKGVKQSEKTKRLLSKLATERMKNPVNRQKSRDGAIRQFSNPENRQKVSERQKKYYEDHSSPFKGNSHKPESIQKLKTTLVSRDYKGKNNPNYGNNKLKGKNNPNYGKDFSGKNNPHYGKKHSPEAIQKMKNRIISDETRLKMSLAQKKRFSKA
jgi:group I intron endonuclease